MMPLFGGLLLILRVHHAFAVTELTDTNFYDYAKDKDVLLVDFYAPWCSDCKALDPDFESAAANLGTRSVDLAKVDCFGAGKGLCGTYGVKRWPTLKNFNRGQYTGDYTGGLTSAEIAGYISTVENSVHPVVNPYAAPFNPQPAAVQTEQCVTKCKISRLSNKQRCFEGCKAKSYGKKVMLPQPVINEKSCAKCRQPQVAGKYRHLCSRIVEKQCNRLMEKIWKKTEKPRSNPSIAPDLFRHSEKESYTAVISGIKPNSMVGAFVRVPNDKYTISPNWGVPRVPTLVSGFHKINLAKHALNHRPLRILHRNLQPIKQYASFIPSYISTLHQQQVEEKNKIDPEAVKEAVTARRTPIKEPGSSAKLINEKSPVLTSHILNEGKNIRMNTTVPNTTKGEQSIEEKAQLKKNINVELSTVAPSGDNSAITVRDDNTLKPLTKIMQINEPSESKQLSDNIGKNTPLLDTEVTNQTLISAGDTKENNNLSVTREYQNANNMTTTLTIPSKIDTVDNAISTTQANMAPENKLVTDKSTVDTAINNKTIANAGFESNETTIDLSAEDGQIRPSVNSTDDSRSNSTAVYDKTSRTTDEQSISNEVVMNNISLVKEAKSFKPETEKNTQKTQFDIPLATNNPLNITKENDEMEKSSARLLPSFKTNEIENINSIETQLKSGALSGATSQLDLPRKQLNDLPADIALKLPYANDDKKERIPTDTKYSRFKGRPRNFLYANRIKNGRIQIGSNFFDITGVKRSKRTRKKYTRAPEVNIELE